ncbi:UDP-N-acetylmuramoyl-L-alanyl-D-glutamate--2,6-diaminopimelate ligase [Ereboglobus sp. PH5-5]|uniref:UDP-N-acetylmuramoyl-L-alanyl-D-glutamate--2, 6-diaminopimelate ligase n=1 Tax=Ereboglobus sp. PH5-5 TaxID=2940529 RepID=UPI002405EA02|nr:UDP-N-acetylmuramoyl-L-alanyl-D-glutamate--2,6-diaminopimelate ligase [Ereboglobus sp. PH5-5]MDF9833245.1 UDP-N-acetylmuramoyl-L-alanyl-D-glutamate--2,6-diaminopimelate ligase [Ereboglobus sp. PH5-5]
MISYLTQNHFLVTAFRDTPAAAMLDLAPAPRARRTPARAARSPRALKPHHANNLFKMAPKLSDYFKDDEIIASKGPLDRPISGIVMDSRRVVPGNLYFALPGLRTDGGEYIDEAINRGAVAIVTNKLPLHAPGKATFIQVADPRAQLARVSQRYYRFPDRDMTVVGVTGTNGKTTVTHLLKHLLNGDQRVGLVGTINYDLGARTVPSFKTTPESIDIYGMLAQMRDAGCRQTVMEVSSHGIDQNRVLGMHFDAAVFTNLTRDHLDYHKNLDEYFDVKTRLFTGKTGAQPKLAVINIDDPRGPELVKRVPEGVRVLTFGESPSADVRAENISLNFKNTTFRLVWSEGSARVPRADETRPESRTNLDIDSPLIGRYNVSNLLAAVATAIGLGRDPLVIMSRLKTFTGVAGRMERIEAGQPFNALVDYAHTDDALRNALGMLRAITPGRLLVVFGCGGNRDRAKRPLMMRAVQEFADYAFATADNPRSEPLQQIFDDMKTGVTAPEKLTWIEDRRRAISLALDMAKPGDCLLVAGKGHESYQEFADTVIPFDDRQTVRELINLKTLKS